MLIFDQAFASYLKPENKIDDIISEGFTPKHVRIDRGVEGAMGGVIELALNVFRRGEMPRTVPLAIAMDASTNSTKTTLELLK